MTACRNGYPASPSPPAGVGLIPWNRWASSPGIGGPHPSESVGLIPRNRWTTSLGIGGPHHPEYALDFVRKPVDPVELTARVGAALRINMSMLALRDQNVELQRINLELRTALDEIETLSGLLPLCCHCREVRSDDGYWSDLESYLVVRVQTQFSHGICPSCMDTHYSDLFADPDIEQASKAEPGVGSNRN